MQIGDLDTGAGTQTPGSAMTKQWRQQLRADIKALLKDNARLKKENDLEEASAFSQRAVRGCKEERMKLSQ